MMMTFPEEVRVRRPTMNDVSAVFTLMLARNQAEYSEVDMTEEHIRNFWQAPDFNMATDAWAVTTHDGQMIGYASVWHQQHVRIYTYFTVLSEYNHLHIKARLLDLVERRAQQYLAEAPAGTRVTLGTGIADVNIADQQLLAQAGYHRERGQWRMEIEMYEAPPLAVWPEGVSVRPCIPEQDTHAIFETQLDAFAEHRGYTQPSFETWEHFHVKQEGFDPSLWFLACEGKTVAGICLCNYWVSDGFVGTLGVGHSWRRKGLGLALLHHSFAEFYRRGTRTVKLMVDTLNPTGATRLYERAGMHVTQLRYLYEKELRPGKEPGDLTTTE